MSFFKEISDKIGHGDALVGYNIINFNGEYIYIEGIGRILTLENEKIELSAGKKIIIINGENLEVVELEKGAIIIKGRILGQNAV